MYGHANQLQRVPASRQGRSVASLITGEHLIKAVETNGLIKDGIVKAVEGAKYDFRMSPIILKSSFITPVDIGKLPEDKRAQAVVEPGEVVFVKTIESLDLPNDVIATLSPKRKLSHLGIIVLGGFAIDPKYKGPLYIGLYNFSSTPFPLIPNRKIIAAMFYHLEGEEISDFPDLEPLSDQDEYPDDLISLIRNYKPADLTGLTESVSQLQSQFKTLQEEVRDDKSWRQSFRESLDEQSRQIKDLLHGLQDEKQVRKEGDDAVRAKLDTMTTMFTTARIVWAIVWTALALLIGHFGPKLLAGKKFPMTTAHRSRPSWKLQNITGIPKTETLRGMAASGSPKNEPGPL